MFQVLIGVFWPKSSWLVEALPVSVPWEEMLCLFLPQVPRSSQSGFCHIVIFSSWSGVTKLS